MRLPVMALAALLLLGCQKPAPGTDSAPPGGPAAAGHDPSAAPQALDQMDTRAPVPLLPLMAAHQKRNMRDHLAAVQAVVLAASLNNFAEVESAAVRIGYSERMGAMCEHMGAGAPGFTEQALAFHHTADTIAGAARRKDMPAVLDALGRTLQTCNGCHAAFKQSVVDEASWNRLTGSAAPASH